MERTLSNALSNGMEKWNLLLGAHDHIWNDRKWPVKVRIAACNLLREKIVEDDIEATLAPDEDAAPLLSLHHNP